jgi:hypothetical protein
MKEFLIKLRDAATIIAFVTLCVIMVMVACVFGMSVSNHINPVKETVCASGTVYVKEANNYWIKTNKECFPSIPVTKD